MSPLLMEALQILKFYLKKDCLNFTAGWVISEEVMSGRHKPSHSLTDALDAEDRNTKLDYILKELDIYDSNS